MWVVPTIQQELGQESSVLINSRKWSASLGQPGWCTQLTDGLSRWTWHSFRTNKTVIRPSYRQPKKKPIGQQERLSIFNQLVNKMAYGQQGLKQTKRSTEIIDNEEKENANIVILKLLQQEQFIEEIKSLKPEKEIPKSETILHLWPLFCKRGLVRIGKSLLYFNAKHQIVFHWNHHVAELFLRNQRKKNNLEGNEHIRKIVCSATIPDFWRKICLAFNKE